MKTTLSTALSMTAILATGGAALMVNATVLDPQAEAAAAPAEGPSDTTTAPAPQAATVNEFQIPGVGLVTLTDNAGVLTLDSVTTSNGYSHRVVESTPGELEIRFASAAQVVTFTAKLVDGQIVTSATGVSTQAPPEVLAGSSPSGGGGAVGGGAVGGGAVGGDDGSYDDGSYDDDRDDDDHEDHEDHEDHDEHRDSDRDHEGGDDD